MADLATANTPNSTRRRAQLAVIAGAVLATLATAYTFRAIRTEAAQEQWVAHSLEVRQQIAGLVATIRGAGSGIRVYLLTHSESQLEPYRATRAEIPLEISRLATVTADNAEQRRNVARLRPLVETRLARFEAYLHGEEPTAEWLDAGNRLMDQIRAVTDAMDSEELRLLALRRTEARANERNAEVVALLGLVFSLAMVILGWWLQRWDLGREARLLKVLHIGSAVSNTSGDTREALQRVLDEVCRAMGWGAGHAHVERDGKLVSSGLWHLPEVGDFAALQSAMASLVIVPGAGLTGSVMTTRRPGWFADVATQAPEPDHRSARAATYAAGFRGVLAVPVLAAGKVPAVLEFFTKGRAEIDLSLLEVLAGIGVQLGRVFEREQARALQEEQARKIEALSITDELTGLLNRRGFIAMASHQLKVSRRAGEKCGLMFLDMDGLKRINDELGHAAGDDALVQLAGALRRCLRETDLMARLGGDEFVSLAVGIKNGTGEIVERIRASLRGRCAAADVRYPIEVSIGEIVAEPEAAVAIESLLASADSAMYEQKKQHRNARIPTPTSGAPAGENRSN